MKLTKFGTFEFQNKAIRVTKNFANVVPATVRLPGLDGGFDEYGIEASPSEIGNITVELMLNESNPTEMQRKRDAYLGLAALGTRRLYFDTLDYRAGQRWVYAKVNNVQMSDNFPQQTHTRITVTINFQVVYPRMFTDVGDDGSLYGGAIFGDADAIFGGGVGLSQACSGTSTSFSAPNAGNADAYPLIFISTATGQTAQTPILERLVNGVVIDSLTFSQTLNANFTLRIDCATKTVLYQGVESYINLTALNGEWMRLPPGSNSMRLRMTGGGNACTVRLAYYDTWF